MSESNEAAWIAHKGARIVAGKSEHLEVDDNSVVIRNRAVALNPLDYKMQDYGILVKAWPTILGCDTAGEIFAVGKNVTQYRRGQRVAGLAVSLITGNLTQAAFQHYTSIPANLITTLPDTLSFAEAAVLPLGVSCAAAALYDEHGLNLPLPSHNPSKSGKTLLVWGGSSSVGSATIQLARASGVNVIATASQRNFAQVHKLGASEMLDYNDQEVEEKLFSVLKDTQCVGAFDTIGTNMARCMTVIARLGGGHVAGTLEPPKQVPDGVTTSQVFATAIKDNQVGAAIFHDYLPAALGDGSFVPWPAPTIAGHGLDQIQGGIDRLKQGVSATKLVVTL